MTGQEALGKSAARGAATVLLAQAARVAVQTISMMILARLLDPTDYGLMALVMVVVSFADIFRDFGLSAAAIQAKTLTTAQRTNLFWANTLIGLALALLVVAIAPLVAAVFKEPLLVDLTRVMGVIFLINGAATQYRASLTRSLRFGIVAWTEVAAQAVGLALGVVLALRGFGYWTLAAMQICVSLTILVVLVAAAKWLPGLPRRNQQMRPLLRFGGFLVGSQLVAFAANNIDSMVLGRRFAPDVVGYYDRPYRLLMLPLAQIRAPSTSVALPVLSKLQDDPKRYNDFLLKGQMALGLGLVVGLGFVSGAAEPVTGVILGPEWAASAPVLALLAIGAGVRTLAFVAYWVYLSRALTPALMKYVTVTSVMKIGLVIIGGYWGAVGVAAAVALAQLIEWPLSLWWLSRLTTLPLRGLIMGALRVAAQAGVVWVAARAAVELTPSLGSLPQLLVAGAAALVALGLAYLAVPAFRADARTLRPAFDAVIRRGK